MHDPVNEKLSTPPWLIATTCFALLIIGTAGLMVYHAQRDFFDQQAKDALTTVARVQADQIEAWRSERIRDAAIVTASIGATRVAGWLHDPDSLDASLVAQWLSATYAPSYYTGATLVDSEAGIRLTSGETMPHVDERLRDAIEEAARTGQAQITDPYVAEGDESARIHLVAPLFDSTTKDRRFLGAVFFCMTAGETLFPLIAVNPLGSESAETVLVKRSGEYAHYLNYLRDFDNSDISFKVPLSRTEIPAVKAAMGETGTVRGYDYRGVAVFAHIERIPGTEWLIVNKMDEEEVFAGWRVEVWTIWSAVLGLMASAIGTMMMIRQRILFSQRSAVFASERERLAAQQALTLSEQWLSLASEAASQGFWDYDIPTGRIETNRSFAKMHGFDPATFVESYSAWADRLHPDDRVRVETELRDYIEGAAPEYRTMFRAMNAQGEWLWILCIGTVTHRDENGIALRILGVDTDITSLKEAQIEAATARQLLQDILDTIPVRVFWKDLESRYLGCNRPFAFDAGCASPDEVLGKTDHEMGWAEQAELYRADDRRVMDTGVSKLGYEEPQTSLEGRRGWLRTSKVPLRDGGGHIIGVLGTYEDITSEKHTKLEIAQLNENLEQLVGERTEELSSALQELQALSEDLSEVNEQLTSANEAKTVFLRSMSHELRTPLNSVIGFSSLMLQGVTGPMSTEQRTQLEMINISGKHLLELINDILDLTRIEAGGVHLVPSLFSVEELLQGVVASIAPQIADKSLVLTCEVSDATLRLTSDPVRIRQILLNLLGNAIKFTSEGSITIRAWRPADGKVAISVTDTGCGISPADHEIIFEEFTKAQQDSPCAVEGTGLGLPISRTLATLLGGTVTVESTPGQGSTFTLLLPETPASDFDSNSGTEVHRCW